MRRTLHLRWITLAVVAAGLLGALMVAGPVLAGNGNGKGKGKEEATLTVSASESLRLLSITGETVTVSGEGFRGATDVLLVVSGSLPRIVHDVDRAGSWSTSHTLEGEGPWTFAAWQYYGHDWHKMAVTVYE